MRYYTAEDPRAQGLIAAAEEVLDGYFSKDVGAGAQSVAATEQFIKELEIYLTGADSGLTLPLVNVPIKAEFRKRFREGCDVAWTEYLVATGRIACCKRGEEMYSFGIAHNARFVNWILRRFEVIPRSANLFGKENKEYLDRSNAFPWDDGRFAGMGRAECFYRNAKRAEMYYKPQPRGGKFVYDMYTSLILSRMAVEQYIKDVYERRIGPVFREEEDETGRKKRRDLGFDEIRKALEAEGAISGAFSNEIKAVQARGNITAHASYASYAMAAVHNLDVLKECLKYFEEIGRIKE